jgi:hypothetical protein
MVTDSNILRGVKWAEFRQMAKHFCTHCKKGFDFFYILLNLKKRRKKESGMTGIWDNFFIRPTP